jgi:hypothetical protein
MSKREDFQPISAKSLELFRVFGGAKRLLNIEPSWDAVADRLSKYPLIQVMNVVGRVDAILRDESDERAQQIAVAVGLFGPDAKNVLRRLGFMEYRDQRYGTMRRHRLFGLQPLHTLLQVACHACSEWEGVAGHNFHELGEALLIINDLIVGKPEGALNTNPDGRDEWLDSVYYFSVRAMHHDSGVPLYSISRTVDLFLADQEELHHDPDYVDLPTLFAEATGVEVEAYFFAVVALLGRLYTIKRDNVGDAHVAFDLDLFNNPHLSFTQEEAARLFAIGGSDVTSFVETMQRTYPRGHLRPYYHLPLEQSPLVRFSESAVCLSVQLLERRLTNGVYHFLLNARKGHTNTTFRDRLLRYIGKVFERYVGRTIQRIVIGNSSATRLNPRQRFIDEAELRAVLPESRGQTPRLADGIVVLGRTLLVIEAKARLFRWLPVRKEIWTSTSQNWRRSSSMEHVNSRPRLNIWSPEHLIGSGSLSLGLTRSFQS